jgi:hypothetical protein
MHMLIANSAFDLPIPHCCVHVLRLALQSIRRGMGLLGIMAQSVVFFAVLWLLAAGPGFLSARDSLVPAGTGRLAPQASR